MIDKFGVVDSSILDLCEPRTSVLVDLDEIPLSAREGQELMVIRNVNKVPIIILRICVADVRVECIVLPIVFVNVGILRINCKGQVDVVIGETRIKGRVSLELRVDGLFVGELTSIEHIYIHVTVSLGQRQPLVVIRYGSSITMLLADAEGLEGLEYVGRVVEFIDVIKLEELNH